MAIVHTSGFELNSTGANVEWSTLGTGQSIVSTVTSGSVPSGTYCGKISGMTSATPAGFLYKWAAATAAGPFFLRTRLYVHTRPSASNHIISFNSASGTVGGSERCKITLESDGTLILRNASGTQIGSASSALSNDTWYVVELKSDASPSSGSRVIEGRLAIDDNSTTPSVFATTSTETQGNSFAYSVGGNLDAEAQTTGEWYFDDCQLNDNTGSFQTSYPGRSKLDCLRPNGAGDANGFLAQVGGTAGSSNNYTRVNEVTPDDATSYNGSAVLNAEDLFAMGDSVMGASDTVQGVLVGVRMADLVSADATAAFKLEVEKTSAGTKAQSATIIPNSTTWQTNANAIPRNYNLILHQDPDGSNWTQSTINSMQTGYIQTAINVQTIAISTLWVYVVYTPAVIASSTKGSQFMMMGMG